ncbi:MAG: helix-turn-helix domain-containing protein [Alphaproteobacteria bacterium]|nr:MAG: helix-turn-helix domain-containing protein [Alphaproteobacteria bacterium]
MKNDTDPFEHTDTVSREDEASHIPVDPVQNQATKPARYTFGNKLQDARNKSRLQLERIAKELKIRQDYLVALEESNPTLLPEPVFTMGFIRSYARMIKIDPEPHINAYKKEVLHWTEDTHASVPASVPTSFTQTWIVIASALGVFCLYGIWFLLNHRDSKLPLKVTNPTPVTGTRNPDKPETSGGLPLKTSAAVPVPHVLTDTAEAKPSANKPTVLPHSIKNTTPTPNVDD